MLNPKQQRFCQEYIIDLNATQAAIRAEYSGKTAYSQGQRLLKDAEIQAEIQKSLNERSIRTEITQDMVIAELAKLSFHNMKDYIEVQPDGYAYIDLSALTREQAAAITEITVDEYTEGKGDNARNIKKVKIKLTDKKGPLELLGKHLGLFGDKLDVNIHGALADRIFKAQKRAGKPTWDDNDNEG